MKLSVIIPAYNAATYVCRALDSVKNQTRLVDQIIVSDDGSKDNTMETVRRWVQANGIKVDLITGSNGGIAVARNRALQVATGEAICLLDADDEMLPKQVERLAAAMETLADAVVVFGDVSLQYPSGERREGHTSKSMVDRAVAVGQGPWLRVLDPFTMTLAGNRVPNQCTFIKTAVLRRTGGWDDEFRAVEDRELFLRLALHGQFYFLPEVLALKHERDESVSRNAYRMAYYAFKALVKAKSYAGHSKDLATALAGAARNYVYQASLHDLNALSKALQELRASGVAVPATALFKAHCRALHSGWSGRISAFIRDRAAG